MIDFTIPSFRYKVYFRGTAIHLHFTGTGEERKASTKLFLFCTWIILELLQKGDLPCWMNLQNIVQYFWCFNLHVFHKCVEEKNKRDLKFKVWAFIHPKLLKFEDICRAFNSTKIWHSNITQNITDIYSVRFYLFFINFCQAGFLFWIDFLFCCLETVSNGLNRISWKLLWPCEFCSCLFIIIIILISSTSYDTTLLLK